MSKAVYPGTFDPVTFGHVDIIERASKMFDHLVVGVLENKSKNHLLSPEERADLIRKVTDHLDNVSVEIFDGLSVDFAKKNNAAVMVRGLRAVTDFEYELSMSQTNRVLNSDVDTVFLTTNLEYAYLSSSTVREVAAFNGDISKFVPKVVQDKVLDKIKERSN